MLQRIAISVGILAAIIFSLQLLPSAADGADQCPALTVTGVSGEGKTAQFSANITGAPDDITFNWSVSDGSIQSGQGTIQISVGEVSGTSVTATVDVGSMPSECSSSASETVSFE